MTIHERQEKIKSLQESLFDCITNATGRAGERIKCLYWGSAFYMGLLIFWFLSEHYTAGFTSFYKITVIIVLIESFSIIYLKIITYQAQKAINFFGLLTAYEPVDYQGYSQALQTLTSSRSDRFVMVLSWLKHEKHLLDNEGSIQSFHL